MILRVDEEGEIILTLPPYVSKKAACQFLSRNSSYLLEQKEKRKASLIRYIHGQELEFGGYFLHITNGDNSGIWLQEKALSVVLPEGRMPAELSVQKWIAAAVKKLEKHHALAVLPERVAFLAEKHGLRYGRVSIRQQKTRWGSCSSENHISLNSRMVVLPEQLCDYIILHELVHTRHKNHGPQFWNMLCQLEPRAREYARALRKYSL